MAIVPGWVWGVCGATPVGYLCPVAPPAAALISLRTFIEHRAELLPDHRSAVVEAGAFWRLMFLNDTLQAVRHAEPSPPRHAPPARCREPRDEALAGRGRFPPRARAPRALPLMRCAP